MICRKIAGVNGKGGCGKSTSLFHIAGLLEKRGYKILVIDLDKQKNLSEYFLGNNVNYNEDVLTIYDVMTGEAAFDDIVMPAVYQEYKKINATIKNIDVFPSDIRLEDISDLNIRKSIKEEFDEFVERKAYDYVIVDMPPSNKYINDFCFMYLVDYLIIPMSSDIDSLKGYGDLIDTIDKARELNPNLEALGVYLSRYWQSCAIDQYIRKTMNDTFKDRMFKTAIPMATDLREGVFFRRPISSYKAKSKSLEAYNALVDEINERIEKR